MIWWCLSWSRMNEPAFILGAAPRPVNRSRVLESRRREDHLSDRSDAWTVANRARRRRRFLLALRRAVREELDRLRLVLRSLVLARVRPRAHHGHGGGCRADEPSEVRTERADHAVPDTGARSTRARDDRLPVERPDAPGIRDRRRARARVPRRG